MERDMPISRIVVRFVTPLACALALGGAVQAAEATSTLRYGIDDDKNINRLPQVVAEQQGYFAREGLAVQIVPFSVSFRAPPGARPISMRDAMSKGDIDMSREQMPLLIRDVLAGRRFVGAAAAMNNPVYFVVARPEIRAFTDLKGKTVAITNPEDGITLWTRKLMAQHGVAKDAVGLKNIAGSGGRVRCMKSGECAAASLAQPAMFEAIDGGGHILGLTNEIGPNLYQFEIVDPAWATAHRDSVVKYIRAINAAVRFIEEPANHDAVVTLTSGYMALPETRTRDMLSYIWDAKNRVLPQRPSIDMGNVKAAIALLGEYGVLKEPLPPPERFVDPSYAAAAR